VVRHTGGWHERVALEPPALAKFDLRTGRELWETTLATNLVAWSVSSGVLSSGAYFDPETGRTLTNNPALAGLTYSDGMVFCLSTGKTATLTALESGTQRMLWKLDLPDARTILEPCAFNRLLCATDSRCLIIDIANRRLQAEFLFPALKQARFLQTERVVIARSLRSDCCDRSQNGRHALAM